MTSGPRMVFDGKNFLPERRMRRKYCGYEKVNDNHYRIFDSIDDRIGTAKTEEAAQMIVRELVAP